MGSRIAFPLLEAFDKTRMVEISQTILPKVYSLLGVSSASAAIADSGVEVTLQVGRLTAPLTILGEVVGSEGSLAVHSSGLPGAFPVSWASLERSRCRILPHPQPDVLRHTPSLSSPELGSICLLEAVLGQSGEQRDYLEVFYRLARRRHFSLCGMEELIRVGSQINPDALSLSFPYHCGGEQARKEYLDILPDVLSLFADHFSHGTKVLSRYGLAVCVGVRRDESLEVPAVYWHPSGSTAACTAPLLHGCRSVSVGETRLEYNGPTASSELLQKENITCYLDADKPTEYDTSVWLNKSLFNVSTGDVWSGWQSNAYGETLRVYGTQYDEKAGEFDLYLHGEHSGRIIAAADI